MKEEGKTVRFALNLLRSYCPPQLYEEIEGDLLQRFDRDAKKFGNQKAKARLLLNVLRFFRPGILLRNKIRLGIIRFFMIRNYILIAFRSFRKQKSFTFLNILGLSLGIAASLLIFQYVKYEKGFDQFHSRSKDIYRIQYNGYQKGELNFESAVAVPAIGPALKNNFPEVEEFTRFYPTTGVLTYESPDRGPIIFQEEKMQWADPRMFNVFDFKLIKGDPATALDGGNKIVMTESATTRFFADADPIGKRVKLNGDEEFEVSGVMQDIPENSHVRFTALLSYSTLNRWTKNQSETAWGWYDFYTYVLLKPGTDIAELQAKLDKHVEKERGEDWEKRGFSQAFILCPMTDIHLDSNLLYEAQPAERRDGDSVYALGVIAIFILVIAWINYINLATARATNRANEVGVRKVVGAERGQLIGQFLTESFILNIIAGTIAVVSVRLLWTSFSRLSGWNIPLEQFYHQDFWLTVLGLFSAGALLSGFYPAIVLSSFKPVAVLKGKVTRSGHGNLLRKSLVIFQFGASIFLMIGSVIVFQQLHFMKNRDLGFDINNTLILKGPRVTDSLYVNKWHGFKDEALNISGIQSVTSGSNIPGAEIYWTTGIATLSPGNPRSIITSSGAVDDDYLTSFGIKVIAGRNFSKERNDGARVLVNQALAEALGFMEPEKLVGEKVQYGGDTVEVIGVIDNYHQMSLKNKVAPLGLWYSGEDEGTYYSIKLSTNDYPGILQSLERPWKTFFPGNPMDYFFLDEFFNTQYDKDDRFGQVFNLFTALAIFIASMGLFGLASFMTLQRTKEIGIRKVLGSSVSGIVALLSKGFLIPVLVANAIAWPLSWWVMNQWLQTFPYRVGINPLIFVLAGTAVVVIAFVSVSTQTIRAALIEPAQTLKYE